METRSTNGILILILGILSLCVLQIPLGPIAWIMGNNALQMMGQSGGDPNERQLVTIGRICGIIGTVIGVLGLLLMLLWFMFVGGLFFMAASKATP